MQNIFVFLDDSGVLHSNSHDRYFVYAGYLFLSQKAKDSALAAYRSAEDDLRQRKAKQVGELKACRLPAKQKRFLGFALRDQESLAVIVTERHLQVSIMSNKLSIRRYKDYCVKRLLRHKLTQLIDQGRISTHQPTTINLFIDNQPTSTNGRYNLEDSIIKEFREGVYHPATGTSHAPLFRGPLTLNLAYCDSRDHELIRASDILANSFYVKNNFCPELPILARRCAILRLP